MAQLVGPFTLAPTGSTGNNNHTEIRVPAYAEHVGIRFVVEAVGGTPTITYKLQGCLVPDGTAPQAADWADITLLPSDSDTSAVTRVVTVAGSYISHLSPFRDAFSFYRLVTSANTNVTYRAELYASDDE